MPATFQDSLLRPVPWLQSFGIDEGMIDAEHRRLVALYNEVCRDAATCPGRARERLIQEDAIGQVSLHFATEESLLNHIGFPETIVHRRQHDAIRALIAPLPALACEMEFVRVLLHCRTDMIEHMIRHDLGFKSHLLYRDGR